MKLLGGGCMRARSLTHTPCPPPSVQVMSDPDLATTMTKPNVMAAIAGGCWGDGDVTETCQALWCVHPHHAHPHQPSTHPYAPPPLLQSAPRTP